MPQSNELAKRINITILKKACLTVKQSELKVKY